MNLNRFFIAIFLGLLGIYLGFKPLYLKQQSFENVPQFELKSFTLYELDKKGLVTFMSGDNATKYSDKYSVKSINYVDNSKKNMLNMKAVSGVYKDQMIILNDGVELYSADGMIFKTKSATYDKEKELIFSDTNYTLVQGKDSMKGSSFRYYPNLDKMDATKVEIKYQIKEELK